MKRLSMAFLFLGWTLMCVSPLARADDEEIEILFNTFYLEGDNVTYVLKMRKDRSFDLYGPGGTHVSGRLRADAKHVTLTSGEIQRFFKFDHHGQDIKLERREKDVPSKGNPLGELPPTGSGNVYFTTEHNWKKKGRAPFVEGAVVVERPAPPPVAPVTGGVATPINVAPAPSSVVTTSIADLVGTWYIGADQYIDTLKIDADGRFLYTRSDGVKQDGTVTRNGGELTFSSPTYKRVFDVRVLQSGIELSRRETDVVKADDTLGGMPPQQRDPLLWLPGTGKPAPARAPITNNGTVAVPVDGGVPVAGAPIKSANDLLGTFVYHPNAFIAETVTFGANGSFTYSDSNGSNASGTYVVDNDTVVLTVGEVERHLKATVGGAYLTLTRTDKDAPKLRNDLATMSPTVQKTARYEAKK